MRTEFKEAIEIHDRKIKTLEKVLLVMLGFITGVLVTSGVTLWIFETMN